MTSLISSYILEEELISWTQAAGRKVSNKKVSLSENINKK